MAVGLLRAQILLDDPSRIYCGTEEPVTGYLALTYRSQAAELFGPLTASVTFYGRAKSKVYKSNGNNRTIYRGRAPLFTITRQIHSGSFRAVRDETHRIPFELPIPSGVQQMANQGRWEPDSRFSDEPGHPLPPTFSVSYHGFAHRFDALTEYRIGAQVAMQGIDIKISGLDKDSSIAVLYEQPAIPLAEALPVPKLYSDHVRIQNEHLLPVNDRPSGFKAKTKALLSSDFYPEYHFDVFTSCPQKLFLGQPIAVEIKVQPNESRSTAPLRPDVKISSSVTIEIQALTEVRAERSVFASPDSSGSERILVLTAPVPDHEEPFGKANEYTKLANSKPISGIPSGFSTFNILRRYTMKVSYSVTATEKTMEFRKTVPVLIMPPIARLRPISVPAVAGPSSTPAVDNAPLPVYEQPPAYHDAAAVPPLEDEMQKSDLGNGKASTPAV